MALNFGILKPVNIGGQIMAGEQEAQRNQLAQQQLKTGEMQQEKAGLELRRFKRGQDGLDVFLRESTANGKTGSPEAQTDSFYKFALTQGDPTLIMAAQQLNQAAKERSAYQASRTPGALAAPAIAPTPELPGVTVGGPNPPTVLGAAPTANRLAPPPVAAAPVNRLGVDTNALQTRIDELRSMYPNVPQALKEADRLEKQLDESRKLFSVGGNLVTGAGDVRYKGPDKTNAPPVSIVEYERAKVDPAFMRFLQERAAAIRPPAAPRPESAPVAVIGPDGKPVLVKREESFGMTPANMAEKPLTNLQKQALKKDFAADTSKIKAAVDTADEMEKLTDDLVGNPDKKIPPHPGLSGIKGFQGLLASFPESPVTSGNAAKAEQKLETFKGKIKALGRSIASLDGKLGNMAVQEWQMVSDSVQAIKPTAGNLDEQMRDAVRQARLLAKNLRDKFDLTYEDTAPAAAPGTPAPAAVGGIPNMSDIDAEIARRKAKK